jgi:hypothetical protein
MTSYSTLATQAIQHFDPKLKEKFLVVAEFLKVEPGLRPSIRGGRGLVFGSREYFERLAEVFVNGRHPKAPLPPSTVPDELVSVVLNSYFHIPLKDLNRVKHEHQLSMASENIVGNLLERYISSQLEKHSWVWCSGEVVKSVDFIKPPGKAREPWCALQVKNRDNSENSSSAAIRQGTIITKWYRTKSRTGETMWANFPDSIAVKHLSEAGLMNYAKTFLGNLREDI